MSMSPNTEASPVETAQELIDRLRIFDSTAECLEALDACFGKPDTTTLAFVNAHAFNLAWENEQFASDLRAGTMLLRDGKGMEMLLSRAGHAPGANLNGTDLIPEILGRYRDRRVAILGTKEPWLGLGSSELRRLGCDIVLAMDGFQPVESYLEEVERTRPEIVLLAMGMPRQERVAQILAGHDGFRPQLAICGGAIVDFLAGRHRRAPRFLREAGLEWVFRLMLEPRRLFRRYVIGNANFMRRMAQVAGNRECSE